MDFFAAQDSARRSTSLLVALFFLAIIGIITLTSLLVMLIWAIADSKSVIAGQRPFFNGTILFGTSIIVLLIVGLSSWYKMSKLASSGGDGVALMMGGEPVFSDDPDFHCRRLVNIVEEMAIAAGMPVPQPYVLPEKSINAFAAGYSHSDAVVAVTRGAMLTLSREQLQGVIAHEFSHILNGDMRLNIRLMGVLHGILVLGIIGRQLLHGGSTRSSRNGGIAVGSAIVLVIMGYIGTIFGNIIKAAVNRQREFLADAAAVQFTRNPDGIGGALLQIGGLTYGSIVTHSKTEEISHLFFGEALSARNSFFATHPPLSVRIKRILPAWDGHYPEALGKRTELFTQTMPSNVMGLSQDDIPRTTYGNPGDINIRKGTEIFYTIPPSVHKCARDPFASQAVIIFLLLDNNEEIRARQMKLLETQAARGIKAETQRLLRNGLVLSRELHLPVLELMLPPLRRLSEKQCHQFITTLKALIIEDHQINLFEWCILTIITEYLRGLQDKRSEKRITRDTDETKKAEHILFSYLCYVSGNASYSAQKLFSQNTSFPEILRTETLSMQKLSYALHLLRRLSGEKKGQLYHNCAQIVFADNRVESKEAEILRAIAAALDIPAPPA